MSDSFRYEVRLSLAQWRAIVALLRQTSRYNMDERIPIDPETAAADIERQLLDQDDPS